MGGQHYYHNTSGPVDIDLFNNLTSSGSNHHATPSIANVNTTTTASMGGGDGRNLVVVGILIALIVLLCLFLALVAIPPIYAIWRSAVPVNPKKVERRYRTIEGWLISKRIHEHDEHCDRARRAYTEQPRKEPSDAPPPIEACLSADETVDSNSSAPCCGVETACCDAPSCKGGDHKEVNVMSSCVEEHECPICMEPFLVGQTVSWAASTSCEHVFHHSCIKEWLLRHIHCPCCREIYLLVDCPQQKKFTTADLQKLAGERKKRYDQTYFCVKEGLVTLYGLPPSPSNAERKSDELLMTVKSKTKSGVSKSLLATMRSTPALGGESCSPSEPSSPRATPRAEETQQPTSTSSSSPSTSDATPVEPDAQSHPAPLFVPEWDDAPFDEVSASDSNVVSRTETDSSLRPTHLSLNAPIASSKSPRINKSIWRGVDEGQEVPSVLMPLSKSLIGEEFDVEDAQVLAVVRQTDSFKENQTESPKVNAKAITLIMGVSKGQNRRSAKPKVSVTQPFLSENYQNV